MDDLWISWDFNFAVKKLRGKDEFEIYKNYINDLPFEKIAFFLHIVFETGNLKTKSNSKARYIRSQGNDAYRFRDCEESLRLYTKSLRYATYNGKEYAVALANRSAIYFAMEDYKSCIGDINLCLNAKYPNHLKPKVYIRKAKCFQKLGEATDMRSTLVYLLNYLDSSTALLKSATVEKYKKIVKDLITATVEQKPDPEDKFDVVPALNANPNFLNASSSVMLKYNKRTGYNVVAKEEIVQGEVLFVEKAYAFAPYYGSFPPVKIYRPMHCEYCLLKITNSIPCKRCVKHLYCNEKCRDAAWKEFHQWECIGIQGSFFRQKHRLNLALRVIVKAVLDGIYAHKIDFENVATSYGNKDNNYPYVYNLHSFFHKLEKDCQMEYVSVAAMLVNYLKIKTNFFEWMKQLPAYANRSCKELMNKLGGLIIRHLSQFRCSTVPIKVCNNDEVPNVIPIATAVCPSMVLMNHSCLPNTAFHFVGDTVVVKATKNIKVNQNIYFSFDGISFCGLEKGKRQMMLQTLYHLKCSCELCSDPKMDTHEAYLCIKCKGPAPPLNGNNYQFAPKECACLNCNYKFTLPTEVAVKERLAFTFLVKFYEFEDIDDANRCLLLSKTVFRPNHSIFRKLYNKLLIYYENKGEAECFIKIGKMLIHTLENIYSVVDVEIGIFRYMFCISLLQILQKTAVNIEVANLGVILEELTNFLEKTKMVFSFQYPQFGVRLQKVEKAIFELRILHTMKIANRLVQNPF